MENTKDMTIQTPEETYQRMKASYVIFVCTDDYYKRGLALYKRKSVIEGVEDILYEDALRHIF